MENMEKTSLRVRLRSQGRKVGEVLLLGGEAAVRLRPGQPSYSKAAHLLGLGRVGLRGREGGRQDTPATT